VARALDRVDSEDSHGASTILLQSMPTLYEQ